MSKLMGTMIDSRMKASWKLLEEWQSTIYSMMVFGATMVVMFWASVFLYTSFYFTYMPQESITWPIHLQYKSCGDQPGICSFPNSLVSVTDPSRGSLLARGQKYRVVVDLEMPESPTNQKSGTDVTTQLSGMFLITMEMRSFTGDVLRKASRSSMLRYKSPLLQAMSTFIFAPFLLYGAHEEKQLVTAELFSQYEEDPVTPLSDVHIEIGSRNIEIYGAQLRIHATFAGLRHFMYYYPLTAAVFGIGVCMVFLSLIVLFSWYQFSMPAEKMILGPGGHPNGRLSVEDISKPDFEKDAKEGTDDSRCTSSASETSYSPAQMENNAEVEGSGWSTFFSRKPSSTNDDTRQSNTSRRTSSHNISSFVSRRKSSPNASTSSSRRSSARNDDIVQETSKKERSPSFFDSIVGALSTPEDTKDDIQNITLEVPTVRSRRTSGSSAKGDSTSKRSSWIFDIDDSDKEKESPTDDENLKKELGSRKSSWRSSWFGGESDTLDTDDKHEKEIYVSSKHSSRRSSLHGQDLEEELLQHTYDFDTKEKTSTSKRSSWFGGGNTEDGTDDDKISIEDSSLKISTDERRPSILETMFGISLGEEQTQEDIEDVEDKVVENFEEFDSKEKKSPSKRSSWFGGDNTDEGTDDNKIPIEDSSLKISPDERRPSILETMFGISLGAEQKKEDIEDVDDEAAEKLEDLDSKEKLSSSKRSSWFGGDDDIKGTDEEKDSIEDISLKVSAVERRPSILETMFGISFNADQTQEDVLEVPKSQASSRRSSVGSFKSNTDNQEITSMPISVDRSSPTDSRRSSTVEESLGNSSGERKPSFMESMMEMMIVPKDTSSRRSSTGEETNNVLEIPDSSSRRSSRGSTRDNIRRESNNMNNDNKISSRRSSRASVRGEELEVPVIKSGSRRSSIGSLRGDSRRSSRDVALDDAARLLEDANLVMRRKSSIKDSAIKRVSYLLDEGSSSSRRRSSTSEYTSKPSDNEPNRRKSSTSFIKHQLTESSDNDEVEINKTSRSPSRDESMGRKSSTRSEVVYRRRPSSPETRVHDETPSTDQPRPVSGRLSYLFQDSEIENLAPTSSVTAERRPSFMESMMGILVGGGEVTAQDDSDNKEDEK